jgi:hypothetical protein
MHFICSGQHTYSLLFWDLWATGCISYLVAIRYVVFGSVDDQIQFLLRFDVGLVQSGGHQVL